ncbi:MAG: DUF192 domain-containing protein [Halobacteriovoraceae bacterium]|nr:DUF192 domain-containing protein [Halobacteriovoraceae bacterium]MCB9095460.1 DUF192 domain-containing protein [Halobacteriovoraceae bacterium]
MKMLSYQNFKGLLSIIIACVAFSCAQINADDNKHSEAPNLQNDVILKTPRKEETQPAKKAGKTAKFQSKNSYLNSLNKAILQTPSGKKINVYLAITPKQQEQGLSGIRSFEFLENEGMFFFNLDDKSRSFWMPDTYFNLDIFFLDKDLKVVPNGAERNAPYHPGRENLNSVFTTQNYVCRHVLELKSSKLSKEITPGTKLIWISSPDHLQIESEIRQNQ